LRGAQAILESKDDETNARWDSAAVDGLIHELENRLDVPTARSTGFTFAPVYDSKTKVVSTLEEPELPEAGEDQAFWNGIEQKIKEENAKNQVEQYGRGARARVNVSAASRLALKYVIEHVRTPQRRRRPNTLSTPSQHRIHLHIVHGATLTVIQISKSGQTIGFPILNRNWTTTLRSICVTNSVEI
jgi:hypothetical protein